VTASVSDCAFRGSRRSLRSDPREARRTRRKGSAAHLRDGGCGRRREIGVDVLRLPQPLLRPPARTAPPIRGGYCRTTPARRANPHSPLGSRLPGVSRFLKQARPDLLPRDDIGRVLFMPGDAVIKLGPLRIGQRCRVRFQAFPDSIEQVGLLRCGEAVDLASKIAHNPITVPRPRPACKRILSAMVLFFLSVKQTEQHFFDAAGDGGLELLLDSGRVAGFRWPWSAPWVKGYEKECGESTKARGGTEPWESHFSQRKREVGHPLRSLPATSGHFPASKH
jgi:hypothetical protein